jgi:hypothetical protein
LWLLVEVVVVVQLRVALVVVAVGLVVIKQAQHL